MTLLVVGARAGSLGAAIAEEWATYGQPVVTAGISGEEDRHLDLVRNSITAMSGLIREVQPVHVVCTVGINEPQEGVDPLHWYRKHLEVNAIGPLRLLDAFAEWAQGQLSETSGPRHYVAISSNSAFLPRTASAAYCASKAALSQGIRVEGREACGGDRGWVAYGYEPGLLAGTPMTADSEARFSGALHRMRGERVARGIAPEALAEVVVSNLRGLGGPMLNGTLVRFDGGEL